MTDAGRGSRPRNQPNLASHDVADATDKDSSISQKRPAMKFYEPLPLGSDAFMAPLAPPPEPERVNRRRLAVYCILGGALGIAFGGAALAFFSNSTTARPPTVRVMDEVPLIAPAVPEEEAAQPVEPPRTAAVAAPAPKAAMAPAPAAPAEPMPIALPSPPAEPAPAAKPAAETTAKPTERTRSSRRAEPTIDKPSRAQVIAAMSRVQPAVKGCFGGGRGAATVDIKVMGNTGRVASAQVSGQTGAIGSCIARAVRKAQFPKFSDESLSIRYPMAF